MDNQINTPVDELTASTTQIYDEAAIIPVDDTGELIEIEGLLYTPDGAFAGFASPKLRIPDELKSQDDIELYLERLTEEEAIVCAEMIKLNSLIINARACLARARERVTWMRRRYDPQAAALALTLLPRKRNGEFRTKTLKTPFGSISFTSRQASLECTDQQAAIDYCKAAGYEACVKTTESFLIGGLPDDEYKNMAADAELAQRAGMTIRPAMEIPTVKTGIKFPRFDKSLTEEVPNAE